MTVEQLFIAKEEDLKRLAGSLMGSQLRREHDPEDVVSLVFTDFLRNPRDFKSIKSLDVYLHQAINNKVIELGRRMYAQKRDSRRRLTGHTLIGRLMLFVSGNWKTPSSEVAKREAQRKMGSAVDKLETQDRIMTKDWAGGATQEELSKKYKMTLAAINARLYRIKRRLKKLCGIDPDKR